MTMNEHTVSLALQDFCRDILDRGPVGGYARKVLRYLAAGLIEIDGLNEKCEFHFVQKDKGDAH